MNPLLLLALWLGTGVIGRTGSTTPPGPPPSVTLNASFSVTALAILVEPAIVEVDASGTADSDSTIDERTDLIYEWSFDNPTPGNWTNGSVPGRARDYHCCGPQFIHVYEGDTGVRTITLRVRDAKNGISAQATQTVTIIAANTNWNGNGTNGTLCVNPVADADFSACPSGGATATIPGTYADWDDAITNTLSRNNRLLFKCGSTYSANGTPNINRPVGSAAKYIGGYGSCTGNPVIVNQTANTGVFFSNSFNVRLVDTLIQHPGGGGTAEALNSVGTPLGDLLVLRVGVSGFRTLIYQEIGGQPDGNSNHYVIQDSDVIDNTTGNANLDWGIQLNCYHCAFLGNHIGSNIGSHQIRSSRGRYRYAAYNTLDPHHTLSSSVARIKWNSANGVACSPGCADFNSYIGWNRLKSDATDGDALGGAGEGKITFTPQTPRGEDPVDSTEELQFGIIENNWVDMSHPGSVGECFLVEAHDTVVRNNVCRATVAGSGTFIRATGRVGAVFPNQVGQRNKYLQNDMVSTNASTVLQMQIEGTSDNCVFANNLRWVPSGVLNTFLLTGTDTGLTNTGNISSNAVASPLVGGSTFTTFPDFALDGTADDDLFDAEGTPQHSAYGDANALCRGTSTTSIGAFALEATDCSP